jgi:general secretion pathway protein C
MTLTRKTLAAGVFLGLAVTATADQKVTLKRAEVDSSVSNMQVTLTQARVVPYFEHGAPRGYRFFQIVRPSLFSKLGLRDGDVVTAVDDKPLNDPNSLFGFFETLKSSKHVKLGVKRNGEPTTLSVNIK